MSTDQKKEAMSETRCIAIQKVQSGDCLILQKGQPVDNLDRLRGPIRIQRT